MSTASCLALFLLSPRLLRLSLVIPGLRQLPYAASISPKSGQVGKTKARLLRPTAELLVVFSTADFVLAQGHFCLSVFWSFLACWSLGFHPSAWPSCPSPTPLYHLIHSQKTERYGAVVDRSNLLLTSAYQCKTAASPRHSGTGWALLGPGTFFPFLPHLPHFPLRSFSCSVPCLLFTCLGRIAPSPIILLVCSAVPLRLPSIAFATRSGKQTTSQASLLPARERLPDCLICSSAQVLIYSFTHVCFTGRAELHKRTPSTIPQSV